MVIQLKNKSNSKTFTFNWSDGTSTSLSASGVENVTEGITDKEVDTILRSIKEVDKLCGETWSVGDDNVSYKATEGNDIVLQLTPATVNYEDDAAHEREVIVELVTALGERHAWFNDYVVLTLADDAALGSIEIDQTNKDVKVTNSATKVFLRKGYAKVNLNCLGTWANGETNTLTAIAGTVRGVAVSNATSVETTVLT